MRCKVMAFGTTHLSKIVAVAAYEILMLTKSKVICLGSFKCVATRPELGYVIAC